LAKFAGCGLRHYAQQSRCSTPSILAAIDLGKRWLFL
jgi:hypothetical protein